MMNVMIILVSYYTVIGDADFHSASRGTYFILYARIPVAQITAGIKDRGIHERGFHKKSHEKVCIIV